MKLGIIGTGKMASALIRGILDSSTLRSGDIYIHNRSKGNLERLTKDYPDLNVCDTPLDVAQHTDAVMLGVKPYGILSMLKEIGSVKNSPLFISIAAGISLKNMEQAAGEPARIIRSMPNTPALVGRGAIVYSCGAYTTEEDEAVFNKLFTPSGLVEKVEERFIDIISAISGSGPAYMYVILDAMAEAGVALGLPRDTAKRFATQGMLGAATLVQQQSNRHLMDLRDDVTSPGGSTIAALNVLDEERLRHALIRAVKAAYEKNREMDS